MSRRFAEIAFTPSVQEMQSRQGSRQAYAKWDTHDPARDLIGLMEKDFIEARDGFYQATVNSDGWPYVQFRGGPVGFLKVLDENTLGYADFRGNVQYVSVGNMADNDRVSIILMDYANRQRLKILARTQLVDFRDDPALVEALEDPNYRARVERGVVFKIEAVDWNCPQHITPRFTQAEIDQKIAPLLQQIEELQGRQG